MKWVKKRRNVQTGDTVLFRDPNLPSNLCKLAGVTEAIPSKDSQVRQVELAMAIHLLMINGNVQTQLPRLAGQLTVL